MRTALVLGDARCVQDDVIRAYELFTPDVVCACNNVGISWTGHLDYWCTLHPRKCPDWVGIQKALEQRLAAGLNRPQIWAHKQWPGVDRWCAQWNNGSSGGLATKVMLQEGFERIVLAGIPMSIEEGHYYDDAPWRQGERYRKGWHDNMNSLLGKVKSMSGWTREVLGEPTKEWLEG